MRLSLLLLALTLTAGACSTSESMRDDAPTMSTEEITDDQPTQRITLSEPFAVELGAKARFPADDVEVRFDSITSDSRCPANATCVRAGEAYAHFTLLEADGSTTPFKLEMPGLVMEMPDSERVTFQQVDRFSVALYLLQPYPELAEEADMPTTATLEVRRTMR
ncbi:MAG: hypothetical protein ABJF88_06105 [Rhodothermales bacterium]